MTEKGKGKENASNLKRKADEITVEEHGLFPRGGDKSSSPFVGHPHENLFEGNLFDVAKNKREGKKSKRVSTETLKAVSQTFAPTTPIAPLSWEVLHPGASLLAVPMTTDPSGENEFPSPETHYSVGDSLVVTVPLIERSQEWNRRLLAAEGHITLPPPPPPSVTVLSLQRVGAVGTTEGGVGSLRAGKRNVTEHVNGCVAAELLSAEDYGWRCAVPPSPKPAFLPYSQAPSTLGVGDSVWAAVVKSSAGSLELSLTPEALRSQVVTSVQHVEELTAGQLVGGLITSITARGVGVQFLDCFHGTVPALHLHPSTRYRLGDRLPLRVRSVDYHTRTVTLSALPHLQAMGTFAFPPHLSLAAECQGEIVAVALENPSHKSEKVLTQALGTQLWAGGPAGVYVRISGPSGSEPTYGWIPPSHTPNPKKWRHIHKVGQTVKPRVVGFLGLEGLLLLSLRPDGPAGPDPSQVPGIRPGVRVRGTVTGVAETPMGLKLSLWEWLHGFVPSPHLSDHPLSDPTAQFPVGTVVEGRVLYLEHAQVVVTLRPAFLSSALPPLTAVERVEEGQVVEGLVTKVTEGATVQFYNRVMGTVPSHELKKVHVLPGQIRQFRVVSIRNGALMLSLSLEKREKTKTKNLFLDFSFVTASVKEKLADHLLLASPLGIGKLSRSHLSDHESLWDRLFESFEVGEEVKVRVLETSPLRFTLKGSFLSQGIPAPVSPGWTGPAAVVSVRANGLRVELGGGIFGNMESHTLPGVRGGEEVAQKWREGMSVVVRVLKATGGGLPCGNPLGPEEGLRSATLGMLRDFFENSFRLRSVSTLPRVGECLSLSLERELSEGFILRSSEPSLALLPAFALPRHVGTFAPSGKETVQGRILDVDAVKGVLDVTLLPPLLKKIRPVSRGLRYEAEVVLVKEHYVVLRITVANQLVFALSRGGNQQFVNPFDRYPLGSVHSVEVLSEPDEENRIFAMFLAKEKGKKGKKDKAEKKERKGQEKTSNKDKPEPQQKKEDPLGEDDILSLLQSSAGEESLLPRKRKHTEETIPQKSSKTVKKETKEKEKKSSKKEKEKLKEEKKETKTNKADDSKDSKKSSKEENLGVSPGFQWENVKLDEPKEEWDSEEEEEETEETLDAKKSKSRRAKKAEKEAKERLLREKEVALSDPSQTPTSAAEYERLLLGNPNDSLLWVQYMAFHLSMANVDEARKVAQKALKTINMREEKEKLNVWVAWLNLEHTYGGKDELQKVFKESLKYNDPLTMYLKLVTLLERGEKTNEAEEVFERMLKQFKSLPQVWIRYAQFLLHSNQTETFRALLPRALQSLPKAEHVGTISKFAQLEFKHGSPERGRTLFENVLSNYPKRVDVWNVYLQMEEKVGDVDIQRRLYERVTSLKFSSKKMKFFFKNYLNFEKTHGNEEGVAHVVQKASEYVESKA